MQFGKRVIWFALWLCAFESVFAKAAATQQLPVHMFNAHLLKEDENQLSLMGNYSRGVTDTLSFGANVALPIFAVSQDVFIPNLNLKHELFDFSQEGQLHKVSFLGWGAMVSAADSQGLNYGEFLGITDTYEFRPNHFLNLGIYHLRIKIQSSNNFIADKADSQNEEVAMSSMLHWLGAGYDGILFKDFFLHGSVHIPFQMSKTEQSDSNSGGADLGSSIDVINRLGKSKLSELPFVYMLTATNRFDVFQLEYGVMKFVDNITPTVSLFWRW